MSDSDLAQSKKKALNAQLLQAGLYGSLFGLKKLIPASATRGETIKRVAGTAAVAGMLYNGFRSLRLIENYLKNKYGEQWKTKEVSEKDGTLRDLVLEKPQTVFTMPLITQTRAILSMEPLKKVAFGISADRISKLRSGMQVVESDVLGKALLSDNSPAIQKQKLMFRRLAKLQGDTPEQADLFFAKNLAHMRREKGLRTPGLVGQTLDGPVIFYNRQMLKAPSSLINKREALANLLIQKNHPLISRSAILKSMAVAAAGERNKMKRPIKAISGIGAAAVDNPVRFLLEAGVLVGAGYGIKKLVDVLKERYRERKRLGKTKTS